MVSLSSSPVAMPAPTTPPVAKVVQLEQSLTPETLTPAAIADASPQPTAMPQNAPSPTLPAQYFPPSQAEQWQATPEPKPYGYSQNIGVQRYLPLQPRRELTQDEQAAIAQGLQRLLPERLAPSNLTPLPSLLANPTKLGFLTGGLTGTVAALLTFASLRRGSGALPHGAAKGWGLLAGVVTGGLSTVGAYFGRRAYNENVVDSMMRMPPGATYRDMKADPVYQAELDRAAMRSSGGSGDLLSGLLIGSMMSRGGGTSHHYYSGSSGRASHS